MIISSHISYQQQSHVYQAYNNNFEHVNQRQIQLSTDLIKATIEPSTIILHN